MSIVPASRLSSADMAMLGNNVRPPVHRKSKRRPRRDHWLLPAVNRSLATLGESVIRLHRPLLVAA